MLPGFSALLGLVFNSRFPSFLNFYVLSHRILRNHLWNTVQLKNGTQPNPGSHTGGYPV